jgi:REP element-mobilizing transposase RayT
VQIRSREARAQISDFLTRQVNEKSISMCVNYVNPDHVHALIDLPTTLSVSKAVQLLKGSSSHWITKHEITPPEGFGWARGYGAFSVSPRDVDRVTRYIVNQEKHHARTSFEAEYEAMKAAAHPR